MEFTLHYRGDLKSNARPADKHRLREHFHTQLKQLWATAPLRSFTRLLEAGVGDLSLIRRFHGYDFAPLVAECVSLVAELEIFLLWPSAPGAIITSGGDIDNRLKTLLDALKVPSEPTALPGNVSPTVDQQPFFCLFEDDSLITRISVETDRLLEPVISPAEVILTIRVRTKQLRQELRIHPLTAGLG